MLRYCDKLRANEVRILQRTTTGKKHKQRVIQLKRLPLVISELHVNMDHVSPEYALVMKHPTKQNHLQPPKTSQNHPRPAKTTHNHPKPPKTTNNYPKPPTTKWFEIIMPMVENFFLLSI